jgi:hypothetical protein
MHRHRSLNFVVVKLQLLFSLFIQTKKIWRKTDVINSTQNFLQFMRGVQISSAAHSAPGGESDHSPPSNAEVKNA